MTLRTSLAINGGKESLIQRI